MYRTARLLAIALLCCAPWLTHAQQAYVPLEQRLSAEQLRATGLDGLTTEQLRLLNTLLREEQTLLSREIRQQSERALEQSEGRGGFFSRERDPIVSNIAGEFRGWTSGSSFRLDNGQTWRVIATPEYYVPKSKTMTAPAVTITPGRVSGWYMSVEGHSPRAKVHPVE